MGKQTRSKKNDSSIGKGKVTPVQIAFIVDRYLSDNNFPETRSSFRNEASSLISKSPINEAPKSLLSLGAILNEYICLKEQKVMVDQERERLEHEKSRVHNLLQGMQEVMNSYNASGVAPTPLIQASATSTVTVIPQSNMPFTASPAGCSAYRSPTVMPVGTPANPIVKHVPSPAMNHTLPRKRVGSTSVEAPAQAKKFCSTLSSKSISNKGTEKEISNKITDQITAQPLKGSSLSNTMIGVPVQGSSVAKSLFKKISESPPTSSSVPNTPPQPIPVQTENSVSPVVVSSNGHCSNAPQEVTPTNCTIMTSERVTVSPCKHMSYTLERNHLISSSSPLKTTLKRLGKRDHVKGRLDFDGSDAALISDKPTVEEMSTSESDKELDIFDMDLPNLDAFGPNFSFSELLVDLDLGFEGIGCPCEPVVGASDTVSGSSHESKDGNLGIMSEFSSTLTEVISGDDMQGPETLTAMKSVTKSIKILSPAKHHRGSLHQGDTLARE
ncbi:hypothetical protein K2173_000106 [Erythroxylum novogranatense]|uniref:Uncharacterized protein n=1 Tax=Erythroxylum novogranatense TaxID=1862640 RepID=A0AAV8SNJ7_9ROSI|nr:hypothetical protein K2173_000106 [Erythroxylum novogranatense]